jgi:5-methylcytosine-specific restriction protein A
VPHPISKYEPLGDLLREATLDKVDLSLDEVAKLVGSLPEEARKPQFWSNAHDYHDARRRQWLGNGFKAYLDRSSMTVRFIRSADAREDRAETPWSEVELRACVVAYREIWLCEQSGQSVNKSKLRREVIARELKGRSEGSYEFRMQNISALLDELGMAFVRGYLPRTNVGRQKATLIAIINELWDRRQREVPTADRASLNTRALAVLSKLRADDDPPRGSSNVRRVEAPSTGRFVRDPEVVAWVVRRAKGICEACDKPAPFARSDGTPYLEVHHVRSLAEGGPDTVDNAIAACPTCHRRLHLGADRTAYRRAVLKAQPLLKDYPRRAVDPDGRLNVVKAPSRPPHSADCAAPR